MFTDHIMKTGITKKGGLYVLARHTTATLMIRKGCSVAMVEKLPRHRSIQTTAKYMHVSDATASVIQSIIAAIVGRNQRKKTNRNHHNREHLSKHSDKNKLHRDIFTSPMIQTFYVRSMPNATKILHLYIR